MHSDRKFTVIFPATFSNKVEVIKTLRFLTGLGLKDAKDASEITSPQTFAISGNIFTSYGNPDLEIDRSFRTLRNNGVEVGPSVWKILDSLRKLGSQALAQGEDELANEILQLVLAEKLRRETQ